MQENPNPNTEQAAGGEGVAEKGGDGAAGALAGIEARLAAEVDARQKAEQALREREARTGELEKALAARTSDLETARAGLKDLADREKARLGETESLKDRVKTLAEAGATTVARYLAAVQQANPDIPGELIAGETADQVDEALDRARAIVARVRERLAATASVPAGAPGRTGPDLDGLSPREKIQMGIKRK